MLIVTMNDVPGYRITKVIGEVNGLTVRTRNVGAQLGAGLKALAGGELKGLTRQLQESRAEALERLSGAATAAGANAVVAMRYDSNELANTFQEILAYGTAVVVEAQA
ncbi:MAG TPA: heavy metal-binding domain-containing protein [Acidimicrobiales bacterium]|nr:heavy metal-binding domain-containing protein [Acidimicrobiales bacterium]